MPPSPPVPLSLIGRGKPRPYMFLARERGAWAGRMPVLRNEPNAGPMRNVDVPLVQVIVVYLLSIHSFARLSAVDNGKNRFTHIY